MAVNWAPVGQQLAKMKEVEQTAFDTRLGQRLSRGAQEERLKQGLMKTQALQGVEETLRSAGYSPEDAALAAGAARGGYGSDISAIGQAALRNQERDFRKRAVDAAITGGVAAANPYLAGVANAPVRVADLEQGQVFNPYGATDQTVGITAIGQSVIDRNRAQGEAATTRANRAPAARAGRAAKSETYTDPSQAGLNASFNNADGSFNRQAYAAFQSWRARHPGLRDGDEALAAFFGSGGRDIPERQAPRAAAVVVEDTDTSDVGDIGPEEETYVVTEETGPAGVPLSQLGQQVRGQDPATGRTQFPGARQGYQPKTRQGQDFQAAQAAIEAGKNYDAVVKRMVEAGYPEAAKILTRKR